MKNLDDIKNLEDLLEDLNNQELPNLVRLCSRCGNNRILIDRIVQKVNKNRSLKLTYYQLPEITSRLIKKELKIIKNPALLVIKDGELKAILGGFFSQHQVEQILDQIECPIK